VEEFEDLWVVEALLKNRSEAKRSNLLEGTAIALAAVDGDLRRVSLLLGYFPVAKYCRLPYHSKHLALKDDNMKEFWDEAFGDSFKYGTDMRDFWHNDRNLKFSPLFAAVRGGNADIINKMLDAGFIPDTIALLAAITSGKAAVVKTAIALA
jgi:hypothetical protein